MAGTDDLIADLLVAKGMITQDQANNARAKADTDNHSFEEALIALGLVSEENVMMVLAAEYGMECVDLSHFSKISDEIISAVPPEIARRYRVLPIMKNGGALTVAMGDPTDLETLDSLRYILKMDVDGVIAPKRQISEALNHYYGTVEESVESFLQDITEGTVDVSETPTAGDDEHGAEEDAPIIRLVSLIILEAFRSRASDIHLEPLEKRFRVRYRIDGMLREVENPPKYLQNNIISRLKIMSRMDISEHRVPQDGRIQITALGRELDLRVSCLPTTHGESIVMRILDKTGVQLGIPELGFLSDDQVTIDRIINLPDGIFLVTGPTGSGKTTSLYAFLNTLNQPTRKIITAEDPVEYELSGINQCQVSSEIGMTFSNALRSMLRQAPNIIMVGEIRDRETGEIAINAALTGHLVFSTLHTNDAPSAITRLIDMGVKEFLVASALKAVMAQRLVRRLCPKCAESAEASPADLEAIRLSADYFKGSQLKKGKGCPDCNKGFRGRIGIFEIFMVTEDITNLIYERVPSGIIRERARSLGMRTLREDGLRKAAAGMTTLGEVIRATAADQLD